MGSDEFKETWDELRLLKKTFLDHDKDGNGTLQSLELREALRSCGFRVNYKILKALIIRYADKDGNMDFDDWVNCATRLKSMLAKFRHYAGRDNALIASMSLDDVSVLSLIILHYVQ